MLEYEYLLGAIEFLEYEEAKTNREQAIIHLQDFKPLNNAHPKSAYLLPKSVNLIMTIINQCTLC